MHADSKEIPAKSRSGPEAADLAVSGYALLRLSPAGWRRILSGIAGPAIRLHGLRNTRTRMWREAINDRDCSTRRSAAVQHHE